MPLVDNSSSGGSMTMHKIIQSFFLVCMVTIFIGCGASQPVKEVAVKQFDDLPPWSDDFYNYIGSTYGEGARRRAKIIYNFVGDNYHKTELEKVYAVNDLFNKIPWIQDSEHWNKTDYWATPLETIVTFGGDCEDIAIAKYSLLHNMGVPTDHIAIGYVNIDLGGPEREPHMILFYKGGKNDKALVLDNIDQTIKPYSERKDLTAVYAVNAKFTYLINDGQVTSKFDSKKFSKAVELGQRNKENRAKIEKINGGPLVPDGFKGH